MWKTILFIAAVCIIVGMVGYAAYLLLALQKQKKALQQARRNRINRIKESIEIIAKAMLNGDCNFSEGVLRLKMLLEPVGMSIKNYVTMLQLYEVVEDIPTHEARKSLKKNERVWICAVKVPKRNLKKTLSWSYVSCWLILKSYKNIWGKLNVRNYLGFGINSEI